MTKMMGGFEPSVLSDDEAAVIDRVLARLDLVDSAPEEDFDRYTRMVVLALNAPISLLAFSKQTSDSLHFKSSLGFPPHIRETTNSRSFCELTHRGNRVIVIDDVEGQAHLNDFPAVRDYGVRAYLGAPIYHTDGSPIGTLCAMDRKRRRWAAKHVQIVTNLAACVTDRVALRAAQRR